MENRKIVENFGKEAKVLLNDPAAKIILYGSYARGDYNENSDIDVMILSSLTDAEIEQAENRIYDLAFDFQMQYAVDISVIIKNEIQFNYWLGAVPFYDNVKNEGILING